MLGTLAGVAVGGAIGYRTQRTHWSRGLRVEAYADFLRSFAQVYNTFSRPWREGRRAEVDWADWNRTLGMVVLLSETRLASAAVAVDEQMWRLHILAGRQPHPISRAEWERLSAPLEQARLGFVNAARRELAHRNAPVSRMIGRPPASDEVWQETSDRSAGVEADSNP
ncbi:hypothetical protein [Plantactinospora sp. KLBMP9567]|uniref:hypothetical protein n=1 Tax=Plantactinospora sp. KLBMP9567 TaxID=3085900 RepID=UPI0029822715|nr:hypothetical protein [Plantactinospora sp. KLBMP9567]MDW5327503.1 hypothetical protein [Plantactinospora sp. KLBMP9567]